MVSGPCCQLQDVQRVLGRLNKFTILTTDDTTYDGDDESDDESDSDIEPKETDCTVQEKMAEQTKTKYDTDTGYNLSDDTILYVPETDIDTDSTRLDTDCIVINTDTDSTRLDSDGTSDTTPLLIRPHRLQPTRTMATKRLKYNDRTYTDSDATPLLTRTPLKCIDRTSTDSDATPLLTRTTTIQCRQQWKRLFTATDVTSTESLPSFPPSLPEW